MHPFHLFALAVAHRLPGTWTTIRHWYPRPADQSVDLCRIWTSSGDRPSPAGRERAATLRRADGLELYLAEHRQHRVLICPVVPLGLHEDITDRLPAPPSVAAPLDPARATWRITDRVLPHYTAAVSSAWAATHTLPLRRAHRSAPCLAPSPQAHTR
ncbi:hypothetical protein [Streptomyces sp. NPDC086023]|uniref:hypothetical protein n=1 Tax=Streptomyces sp. NPDC086023 TaxID=3365746 RepID=UPI0037CDAFEA